MTSSSYSVLSSTPEQQYTYLTSDLRLTTSYLKVHPKVYWIWTHRAWCLQNIPDTPAEGTNVDDVDLDTWRNEVWARELFMVEKMLEVDARNCKQGRRVQRLKVTLLIYNSSLSPCMELPPLRPLILANFIQTGQERPHGAQIHYQENRIQLFQFFSMASAYKGIRKNVG